VTGKLYCLHLGGWVHVSFTL